MKHLSIFKVLTACVLFFGLLGCESHTLSKAKQIEYMKSLKRAYELSYECDFTCGVKAKTQNSGTENDSIGILNLKNLSSSDGREGSRYRNQTQEKDKISLTLNTEGQSVECINCDWSLMLNDGLFILHIEDVKVCTEQVCVDDNAFHSHEKTDDQLHQMQIMFSEIEVEPLALKKERNEEEIKFPINIHYRIYHDKEHAHSGTGGIKKHQTSHGGGTEG